MKRPTLVLLQIAALFAVAVAPSGAVAKHELHVVRDGSVDLVVSVDWDWNNPPPGALSKAELQAGFEAFGQAVFRMTEGHVRICKLYVYKQSSNAVLADIVVRNDKNTSNATGGGIALPSGQIRMYTRWPNGKKVMFGRLLAHEFGHYGLSLGEEYQTTRYSQSEVMRTHSLPRRCDVNMKTIMGVSASSILSLPGDYTATTYPNWKLKPKVTGKTDRDMQAYYHSCDDLLTPDDEEKGTHGASWRTGQWRLHRQSAWELITNQTVPRERLPPDITDQRPIHRFNDLARLGVPTELNPLRDWDEDCFEVAFIEGTVVILVIDRSMSMNDEVDQGSGQTKMDRAKEVATKFVNEMPAGHSVVLTSFHAGLVVELPLTKIEAGKEQEAKAKIVQKISSITPEPPGVGSTNITSALIAAHKLLLDEANLGNRQYVYLISDGEVAPDNWMLKFYYEFMWIPIFAVNVGPPSTERALRTIASFTTGLSCTYSFYVNLEDIEENYKWSKRLGLKTWSNIKYRGGPIEDTTVLSEVDGDTMFRASWGAGDTVTFELRAPDGTLIKKDQLPAGVEFKGDAGFGSYKLSAPKPGEWTAVLTPQTVGSGQLELDVRSDTPLRLDVETDGSGVYPEPWVLRARLGAPGPVVGAQVKATFDEAAGPTPSEIDLRDDGAAPDRAANDGVYTGLVSSLTTDGAYSLSIEASNPSGKAAIDPSALSSSDEGTVAPIPLTALRRRATLDLEAKGLKEMPQVPADALQIRNDMTPLWGAIEESGDVVWFRFNAYATGTYAVMTGELVSNDGTPMKTKVTLYDEDGKTVLGADAGSDGRAYIEYTAPGQNKKILVKVEHAGGGVGRFRAAVAPAEWFDQKTNGVGPDEAEGCGSCAASSGGGGNAPAALLSLLLLAALLVRRRRG